MPWRKYISAPYLKWPFWIFIILTWINIFLTSRYNGALRWNVIAPETGELAWKLLILMIFLSLAHKLFPKNVTLVRIFPLRKQAGILAFLIVGSHALANIVKHGINWDWRTIFAYSFSDSFITLGTTSFLLMLPLFLTSTEWAIKKMGAKAWFWLHKLAHPAFILAGVHIALINNPPKAGPLIWLGMYVIGYLILWSKKLLNKKVEYHQMGVV